MYSACIYVAFSISLIIDCNKTCTFLLHVLAGNSACTYRKFGMNIWIDRKQRYSVFDWFSNKYMLWCNHAIWYFVNLQRLCMSVCKVKLISFSQICVAYVWKERYWNSLNIFHNNICCQRKKNGERGQKGRWTTFCPLFPVFMSPAKQGITLSGICMSVCPSVW